MFKEAIANTGRTQTGYIKELYNYLIERLNCAWKTLLLLLGPGHIQPSTITNGPIYKLGPEPTVRPAGPALAGPLFSYFNLKKDRDTLIEQSS